MFLRPLIASLLFMIVFQLPSRADEDQFRNQRLNMLERDIKGRGITDKRVIAAMTGVKRHLFVPFSIRDAAYADYPLPIGEGQTISQPYIVALMTEELRLKEGEKVLEVGTGSGYQAAVLAEMGIGVRSIEIIRGLADSARKRLNELGYKDVKVKYGDGYFGWEEEGPFDAIMVTAAANHIPPPLIKQLKEGGRLIIPLGSTTYYQTLTLVTKVKGNIDVRHIMGVSFVPMIGKAIE